ncbi:MAG: M24 family metallopeptidase [Deltaproteobacteria bacterium]|nr:M24 family metallopeptidase [Deltaproteobacteria bacterium]
MSTSPSPALQSTLAQRRSRLEKALALRTEILLIPSGMEIGVPGGLDAVYPFVEHPDFRWLSEQRGPGHVLAFDPDEGWQEFFQRPSVNDTIWTGARWDGRGRSVTELKDWLASRVKAGKKLLALGSSSEHIEGFPVEHRPEVAALAWHARRSKDAHSISLIEKAVAATAAGFKALPAFIAPGRSEREIAAEIAHRFFCAGADALAFPTIVGCGDNSACLHFTPSERQVKAQDWILVDAGASVAGYVADVTRMFPSRSGSFSGLQKELYDLLLTAQLAAIDRCRPGVEWHEVHRGVALDIARGLCHFGIIKSSAEAAVESGAIGVFLPHGVGHMFGLGIRDASGHSPDRTSLETVGLVRLRCHFKLEPGYSMTVEPGCYFIPAYLDQQEQAGRFKDQIDFDVARGEFARIGGLRIEDDIIVGEAGKPPKVLTSEIPK